MAVPTRQRDGAGTKSPPARSTGMTQISLSTLALCLVPLVAGAQTTPQAAMDDGPWIDLPAGYTVDTSPPTAADIHAMADLDGDPSVLTEDEARMIAVLSQILLGSPLVD